MNILDRIIEKKHKEVAERKAAFPVSELEKSMFFGRSPFSLKEFLLNPGKSGIISEFKKKSPSKGFIHPDAKPELVGKAYEDAGASAISVLTDEEFFGGSTADLLAVRNVVKCPILRKDFIIDEYQIVEAKSMGADVILLIAAALESEQIRNLSAFARNLGLEVLMEVHSREELLPNLFNTIDVIGVNNRNLKDFTESIELSIALAEEIPSSYIKISESALKSAEEIIKLKQHGFAGFLIGESLMKTGDPGKALQKLWEDIKRLENEKLPGVRPV